MGVYFTTNRLLVDLREAAARSRLSRLRSPLTLRQQRLLSLPCLGGYRWLRTKQLIRWHPVEDLTRGTSRSPTRPRGRAGRPQAPRGRWFCRTCRSAGFTHPKCRACAFRTPTRWGFSPSFCAPPLPSELPPFAFPCFQCIPWFNSSRRISDARRTEFRCPSEKFLMGIRKYSNARRKVLQWALDGPVPGIGTESD